MSMYVYVRTYIHTCVAHCTVQYNQLHVSPTHMYDMIIHSPLRGHRQHLCYTTSYNLSESRLSLALQGYYTFMMMELYYSLSTPSLTLELDISKMHNNCCSKLYNTNYFDVLSHGHRVHKNCTWHEQTCCLSGVYLVHIIKTHKSCSLVQSYSKKASQSQCGETSAYKLRH